MKHVLPNLKIFRARYPETATGVIQLLREERFATRRRFTQALPDSSTHIIRETLLDLLKTGLVRRSVDGEYALNVSTKYAKSLTPVRMTKIQNCILNQLDKRKFITARDARVEFSMTATLFLAAIRKLIERGLVEYRDVPVTENSRLLRRHYTFKHPEKA